MTRLLTKDGRLVVRDGKLVTVMPGGAEDCECCGGGSIHGIWQAAASRHRFKTTTPSNLIWTNSSISANLAPGISGGCFGVYSVSGRRLKRIDLDTGATLADYGPSWTLTPGGHATEMVALTAPGATGKVILWDYEWLYFRDGGGAWATTQTYNEAGIDLVTYSRNSDESIVTVYRKAGGTSDVLRAQWDGTSWDYRFFAAISTPFGFSGPRILAPDSQGRDWAYVVFTGNTTGQYRLYKIPPSGSMTAVTTLSSSYGEYYCLTHSGDYLWWADSDSGGNVWKVPDSGGTPTLVVSGAAIDIEEEQSRLIIVGDYNA